MFICSEMYTQMDWILYFLYDDQSQQCLNALRHVSAHGKSIANIPLALVNIRDDSLKDDWIEKTCTVTTLFARRCDGKIWAFTGPFEIVPTLQFVCTLKRQGRPRSMTV